MSDTSSGTVIYVTVHELRGSSVVLRIEGTDEPIDFTVQAESLRQHGIPSPIAVGDSFALVGYLTSFDPGPDMQTTEQPTALITIEVTNDLLQVDYGE